MRKIRTLVGMAGLMATAACGGGESGPPPAAEEGEGAEAPAEEAGGEEAAEAVAADNTETTDGTVLADFTGDAAAGETVFGQCRSCHVTDPGVNRTGPSLAGIIGRESGTIEGFNYTDANANSGITWTPEKMFQYLQDPQRVIPGTRMAFAGLPEAQDRADIIAYLQTQ